jgi:hypothetical protein
MVGAVRKPIAWGFIAVGMGWMLGGGFAVAEESPLAPEAARQKLGEQVWVELLVVSAKDRLEKRGEIYLDSQLDFRDEKNLAVVITRRGADSLRGKGVFSPAEHFQKKRIRVKGTVKEVDHVRRIEVDEAEQIELVPQP